MTAPLGAATRRPVGRWRRERKLASYHQRSMVGRFAADRPAELLADASDQVVIVRHAQAPRQTGQPLRSIQTALDVDFGNKLSLDAISRMVKADAR